VAQTGRSPSGRPVRISSRAVRCCAAASLIPSNRASSYPYSAQQIFQRLREEGYPLSALTLSPAMLDVATRTLAIRAFDLDVHCCTLSSVGPSERPDYPVADSTDVRSHELRPTVAVATVKQSIAPLGVRGDAHMRPPCALMIDRQIDSPIPIPWSLVV